MTRHHRDTAANFHLELSTEPRCATRCLDDTKTPGFEAADRRCGEARIDFFRERYPAGLGALSYMTSLILPSSCTAVTHMAYLCCRCWFT